MICENVKIKNKSGLHMRPAGIFIKAIQKFKSEVIIHSKSEKFIAKSMLNILSAAIKCGDEIQIEVNGEDEKECMQAILSAIESGLGE